MFSCPKCPDHRIGYGYSPALCPEHANQEARLCKICGGPIHPQRLAVSPRTLTCKAKCAAENTRRLRNAANRRWQKKKREAVPPK